MQILLNKGMNYCTVRPIKSQNPAPGDGERFWHFVSYERQRVRFIFCVLSALSQFVIGEKAEPKIRLLDMLIPFFSGKSQLCNQN